MFEYTIDSNDGFYKHYLSDIEHSHVLKSGLLNEMILGEVFDNTPPLEPDNFKQNPLYLDFLHWVVSLHVNSHTPLVEEARKKKDGCLFIVDQRVKESVNDEDIIERLTIKNSEIINVERNSYYQVFTENGFIQLEGWLKDLHRIELLKLYKVEAMN